MKALRSSTTLALLTLCTACGPKPPTDWGDFNVLKDETPPAKRMLGEVELSQEDYYRFIAYGEQWFREATFGNERTTTDIIGVMGGMVDIPCVQAEGAPPPAADCKQKQPVLPFLLAAIDRLDGALGNLFDPTGGSNGNGGPNGNGFTSDLVMEFPKGTTIYGIPVPEQLHTGLDVEAGSAFPIGLVAVPVPAGEAEKPYLITPSKAGCGPAPAGQFRLGITCAVCHYSLDVDHDGLEDLRSAKWKPYDKAFNQAQKLNPSGPFEPEHSWAVGNQNLHFGWLFGLAANPLLGFTVLSGRPGHDKPDDAVRFGNWVIKNYESKRDEVMREVIIGMLAHPRGHADDSADALHNPVQIPMLFTRNNWPNNYDGSLLNHSDRNNGVWTGALDFTGLIGLSKDRADKGKDVLFWEPKSVYSVLSSGRFADIMLRYSPAVQHDPSQLEVLKADILGTSDGVPGMLDPEQVVVMEGPGGIIPPKILNHPNNHTGKRKRKYTDYPGDADERGPVMALLGVRIRTPQKALDAIGYEQLKVKYPKLHKDEIVTDAVSLMLDWLEPPPNTTQLLARAASQVEQGYQIFKDEGCAHCHRGPFFTDNLIKDLSYLDTQPGRALNTRPLQRFVAPDYDPQTGLATERGSAIKGLFGNKAVGYKTVILRHLWGSAPYLHDGGVAVALRPDVAPAGDDLRALLMRSPCDKVFGMSSIVAASEANPAQPLRANAALSLQALLLKQERALVIRDNKQARVAIPGKCAPGSVPGNCMPLRVPMTKLGLSGEGHRYYIDDITGGERITALIAFLLALDDKPGKLPAVASPPQPPAALPPAAPVAQR